MRNRIQTAAVDHLTHLGKFQGLNDNVVVPPTAVWTAANGDTVTNLTLSFDIDLADPLGPLGCRCRYHAKIPCGSHRCRSCTMWLRIAGRNCRGSILSCNDAGTFMAVA